MLGVYIGFAMYRYALNRNPNHSEWGDAMDDIIEVRGKLFELEKAWFLDHVLFSIQWWFLLLVVIFLWTTWAILVDKRNIHAILLVGFMTAMLAMLMDEIGLTLSLWIYPRPLSPFVSRLNPVDLAIIPVIYMLLYQYAKEWKHYVIILILISLFAVLIAEPLFGKWGVYIK